MTALLVFSCNKNRFDLDHIETVEGSGQWKLPIGSVHTTLGDVMKQFGENELISYDEDGNLQIKYSFQMDDVIKGSNFLSLGTFNHSTHVNFANPYPGVPLPLPIDTVLHIQNVLKLHPDSATIESAVVKTGTLLLTLQSNLGNVSEVVVSSPDIIMPDGDTLHTTENTVDLAGASFHMHDEFGQADSTLTLNYAIYYQLTGIDDPNYDVTTIIGLNDLKLAELSGYVNHFTYDFSMDTAFSLPLNNIEGQLNLVGAKIDVLEKNTFENLHAILRIDQAELYGGNAAPSMVFSHYPYVLDIIPSPTFVNIMDDETITLGVSTEYNAIRFQGGVDFNPTAEQLIVIRDTSSLSLGIDALIPMQFNISDVTYIDTLDLNMGEISAPSLIKEIALTMLFDSEIPFDLKAQLFTINSQTGLVTDSLLTNGLEVRGSYDGRPVQSEAVVSLTQGHLQSLLEADKLLMRFVVSTDNHDVILNLDNGLGVTLKADVIYGGSIDINE